MTARSSPSHIIQIPYSYYFRVRPPDDLGLHFREKTEIKRPVHAGGLADGEYRARPIAGQVQNRMNECKRAHGQI